MSERSYTDSIGLLALADRIEQRDNATRNSGTTIQRLYRSEVALAVSAIRAAAQAAPARDALAKTICEATKTYYWWQTPNQQRENREWYDAADAVIALVGAPRADGCTAQEPLVWRPFETAPKDGTWIIARCNDHSRLYRLSWGRARNGDLCWCTSGGMVSYGDGLFSPNGGWTPCPVASLPSTEREMTQVEKDVVNQALLNSGETMEILSRPERG